MSQPLISTDSTRQRMMNVPCTGKFYITVESDGYWEVELHHKDGDRYRHGRGTLNADGVFLNMQSIFDAYTIPDWMWESIRATIDEMLVEFERDALDAPQYRQGMPV